MSTLNTARRLNVDNDKAMLVEFVNDGARRTGVSYRAWLVKEAHEAAADTELIQKEVEMWWPENVDIRDARRMTKAMNKSGVVWKSHVVTILSTGGFVEMSQQSHNMLKYGVPNPSRQDRHKLLRKKLSSESESDSSSQPEGKENNLNDGGKKRKRSKKSSRPSHLKAAGSKNKRPNHPTSSAMNASELKKILGDPKEHDGSSCTGSDAESPISPPSTRGMSHFQKRGSSSRAVLDSLSSSSSEDEAARKFNNLTPRQSLLDYITVLSQKNYDLRHENARLKTLVGVRKDLKAMKKTSEELQASMYKMTAMQQALATAAASPLSKNKSERRPQTAPKESNRPVQLPAEKAAVGVTSSIGQPISSSSSAQTNTTSSLAVESPAASPQQVVHSSNHSSDEASSRGKNGSSIRFGSGHPVDLGRLSKTMSISAYTTALLTASFTDEVLGTSSLTGESSNFMSSSDTGSTKKQLDPIAVSGIIDFVKKKFDNADTEKKVKAAIRAKCNNVAAKLRGKSQVNPAISSSGETNKQAPETLPAQSS